MRACVCVHMNVCACLYVSVTHCELVVDLVDVLVDLAVVQQSVKEVVPSVLDHSTTQTLG